MKINWYPENKSKLNLLVETFLIGKLSGKINGIIVPHAGYEFSGAIAGRAFSFLKNKGFEKAIILGPDHAIGFSGIRVMNKNNTPFGDFEIMQNDFEQIDYEHSVDNQIPFLQKLKIKKILPLVVGKIKKDELTKIIERVLNYWDNKTILVVSTDLSHFFNYNHAEKIDKQTIQIIENLDLERIEKINACGIFPLMILMRICKIKNWRPKLIEYKNSGDIAGRKDSVVGYSSFWF